jgi:hypothetical protein
MLKPLALSLPSPPCPQVPTNSPVLADYWTDSGSLPPEYAWETSVTDPRGRATGPEALQGL